MKKGCACARGIAIGSACEIRGEEGGECECNECDNGGGGMLNSVGGA